jgi:predicted AlkP superfamily pyrophosphatase or phosphodiesterase
VWVRGHGGVAQDCHAAARRTVTTACCTIGVPRFVVISILLLVGCGPVRTSPRAAAASRVVVISVDGMMPDVYLDPDAHGLAVPTLRRLVAQGAAARVHGVMPTVTYPSHTTMVTGVPPAVHGIVSNKPLDPLGKNFDGWRWYAEEIAVPTVYEALEAQHRTAALVVWPVTVGAHASIVIPEYWRAGGPDDQRLLRALSTPGVLDAVEKAEPALWKLLTPPDIKDASQIAIARYLLATRRPDLMMIHLFELDDSQHDHGPWSPEAKATLESVDRQIGLLLADLERSPEWANTTLLIVSDHGFAPIDHEIRLGAQFVARGLITLDKDGAVTAADVAVGASGGTAYIYVLNPARRADVDAAVTAIGTPVARRIEHDEIVALGGDPAASFALVAAPGHGFSDKRTGEPIVATSPRGTHGWPPNDPAMAASLIAFGPHINHGSLGTVEMTDIAPTIARWLGVPLPTATGSPISGLVAH